MMWAASEIGLKFQLKVVVGEQAENVDLLELMKVMSSLRWAGTRLLAWTELR